MREILFRGKDTDTGEWVEGYYEFGYDSETETPTHYMWVLNHTEKYGEMFMVIPETVGQYTGLEDRNGKKIFEGDIVMLILASSQHKGEVVFHNGGFCVNGLDLYVSLQETPAYEFKHLGNIHDNPELLSKK